MKKRAILYTRVSTEVQAVNGSALTKQEEQLRSYCQTNNIEPVSVFNEVYSGSTFNRPVFEELMAFAKENSDTIDCLLVTRWNRFSTHAKDCLDMIEEFKNLGIEVQASEEHIDLAESSEKLKLGLYLSNIPVRKSSYQEE